MSAATPVEDPVGFGQRVFESLVGTSWLGVGVIALSAVVMYLGVLLVVRINGLRSLSRISAFDFTVTIATGAVIGSTVVSTDIALTEGLLGLVVLLGLQLGVALARERWGWAKASENDPVLLVDRGEVIEEHLRRVNVTRSELYSALRSAGVARLEQVRVGVMERTGEISVLRVQDEEPELDMFEGVVGAERIGRSD